MGNVKTQSEQKALELEEAIWEAIDWCVLGGCDPNFLENIEQNMDSVWFDYNGQRYIINVAELVR